MSAANNLAAPAFQLRTANDDEAESLMSLLDEPATRISHEGQLRLQLRELDEGGWEWGFLAYADEDKGLLESSSQAGSYCSSAYLKAIKHNLGIVKMACQLEIDAEYELIEHVVMATKEELSRLQRHPELFPNRNIRVKFWRYIWHMCHHQLVESVISKQEARDHQHRMIEAARVETEEDMRIPGRDLQRKPWEQFLHNRAPGTEADFSMFAEEGSIQIIPNAAARILVANISEYRNIIRDIEAQREEMNPNAPFSGNYAHSNALKNSPDGHLRSHQTLFHLLKPTIAGPTGSAGRGDIDSLETLNLDFAALNRRRPPLRPHRWNCVNVVLLDRPNYAVESEKRDESVEEMMSLLSNLE